jgi:hypothetical protein
MRTKIALLSAALVAAGVASSMAQSNVYSLNVVGYVNITCPIGYSLISLPLQSSDVTSSINSVLTNSSIVVPFGTSVTTWNPSGGHYNLPAFAGGDGNWYQPNYTDLATNVLPPGSAFFFQLPTAAQQVAGGTVPAVSNITLTVVGTVVQGTNTYPINAGYGFYGNFEPVAGDIATNGFPAVDNSFLYTWNGTSYNLPLVGLGPDDSDYNPSTLALSGNPSATGLSAFTDHNEINATIFAPAVGSGFIYLNPSNSVSWQQVFKVQ